MEPTQPLPAWQPGPSGLVLDGQPTDVLAFGQSKAIAKQAGVLESVLSQIVSYLAADPVGYALTTAELTAAVRQINGLQRAFQGIDLVRQQPDYARIALALVTDSEASNEVAAQLGVTHGVPMSGLHARAIVGYLRQRPAFAPILTGKAPGGFGVPVRIVARVDSAYGDACYLNGELHLKAFSLLSPYGFLRLFLHEAGHATFERVLLEGVVLPDGVAKGSGPVDACVATMSRIGQNARDFYVAWLELRKERGKHLLGLDLGPGMSPAERQVYQAGSFGEFCAEVLMQLATGELIQHVKRLQAAPGTPQPVLNAWANVVTILLRHRERIFGAAT